MPMISYTKPGEKWGQVIGAFCKAAYVRKTSP